MSASPKFGPGGNSASFYESGHKSTLQAPKWISEIGLDAYEYEAGNGLTAGLATLSSIGAEARKYGIAMSLHTPYFISLSTPEEEKREKSVSYILRSLEAAEALAADTVVIHCGGVAKMSREEGMRHSALALELLLSRLPADYPIRLGLETMGKINQLGTVDEVIALCKLDPRLYPVVDFGHLNARELGGVFPNADSYLRVFDRIGDTLGDRYASTLHCHFSKIEFGKGGEKKHLTFADDLYGPDFLPLAEAIARDNLSPRIICESAGTMAEDALFMKRATDKAFACLA